MKKLTAITTSIYLTMVSVAVAAETAHGDASHGAEEASKGGLPQFEPTWFASQVFWLAVCFAVLYFIFAKKTLPDISSVIDNRKNHIQSDLETAEKLTAEADSVQEAYQEGLNQSQNDAAEAIKTVENKAKNKAESAIESFRQKADVAIQQAEKNIEDSKLSAMDDMNQIAVDAAAQAVEKIIGARPDTATIETAVKNISGKIQTNKAKAA